MKAKTTVHKLNKSFLVKLPYNDLDYQMGLHLRQQSVKFMKPGINNVIVFDFSNVNLIDTHGLAAIMSIWSECSNKNIKLIFCNLNDVVLSAMKSRSIEMLIDIVQTVDDARKISHHYSRQMRKVQYRSNHLEYMFGVHEVDYNQRMLVNFKDKLAKKAS